MRKAKTVKKPVTVYGGLDLSLTGTGVVILDREGSTLFNTTLTNKLKGEARLVYLREAVRGIMGAFDDVVLVIEDYAFGATFQVANCGELGGVIKVLLYELGIKFYTVPPTRLKKFVMAGGGTGTKDAIMMNVLKRWGFESPDNNQADAYGLAQIARALKVRPITLVSQQKEVIKSIIKPPVKKPKKKKEE